MAGIRDGFSGFSSALLGSKQTAKLMKCARDNVDSPLNYQWSETEEFVLKKFFSNNKKRVTIMFGLPSGLCGQFFAMCAQMTDSRGMRGVFVSKFFTALLSSNINECQQAFNGDVLSFLSTYNLSTLDKFIGHSSETRAAYEAFCNSIGESRFLLNLVASSKLKEYFPNSKSATGLFLICFDGISLLTAQGIQRLKPFFGSDQPDMLLSNFYPNESKRDHYPIEDELALLGVNRSKIVDLVNQSFNFYYYWRGESNNGQLIEYLKKTYSRYMDKDELERGAIGESCNILASFIPPCMYTSFGIYILENELPDFLRTLLADETPESVAIADLICREAVKLGYSLEEHLDLSSWDQFDQGYIRKEFSKQLEDVLHTSHFVRNSDDTLRFLGYSAIGQNTTEWRSNLEKLVMQRGKDAPLPGYFKTEKVGFRRKVSFRALCGIQRSNFSVIYRTELDPHQGFLEYDKSLPDDLIRDFGKIHTANKEIVKLLNDQKVSSNLHQYVMAMGNCINCIVFGSLYLWEKIIFENTKFTVPHETRQFFLGCANRIQTVYPWIRKLMRIDNTPSYIFHTTNKPIEMPKKLNPS